MQSLSEPESPAFIPLSIAYCYEGSRSARADPSYQRARAEYSLDNSPILGGAIYRHKQPFTYLWTWFPSELVGKFFFLIIHWNDGTSIHPFINFYPFSPKNNLWILLTLWTCEQIIRESRVKETIVSAVKVLLKTLSTTSIITVPHHYWLWKHDITKKNLPFSS